MSVAVTQELDVQKILASTQIPALPQTAIRLIELSQDAANGPKEFARPIEADPGLTGQVLRFVNSSYFGFSRKISSVQQALALVGVRTIKNFALWSAVFALVPDPKFGPFDLKKLWQDSLRRAIFARLLGRRLRLENAEDLFAAALLQDMAIPLLLKALPEYYEELVQRRASEGARLSQLEREIFGWDHADVAGALARSWQLPESFARLIERHSNLDALLNANPPELDAACVALAALLPASDESEWNERQQFYKGMQRISADVLQQLEELCRDTDQQLEEFAPMMNLAAPKKTLVDWCREG